MSAPDASIDRLGNLNAEKIGDEKNGGGGLPEPTSDVSDSGKDDEPPLPFSTRGV